MSIKLLVLGGGGILGFGGGECRFYFYGREDFSEFLVGATKNGRVFGGWGAKALCRQSLYIYIYICALPVVRHSPRSFGPVATHPNIRAHIDSANI